MLCSFSFSLCRASHYFAAIRYNNAASMAKISMRSYIFLTDRNIYILGEEVWFKVYKMNGLTMYPWDISKVVYLELLDKNNFPATQIKLKPIILQVHVLFFLKTSVRETIFYGLTQAG